MIMLFNCITFNFTQVIMPTFKCIISRRHLVNNTLILILPAYPRRWYNTTMH